MITANSFRIGMKVWIKSLNKVGVVDAIYSDRLIIFTHRYDELMINDCKPILRRVEDMTYDERLLFLTNKGACSEARFYLDVENYGVLIDVLGKCTIALSLRSLDKLESLDFDIRGLIQGGFAVDLKEINVKCEKEESND